MKNLKGIMIGMIIVVVLCLVVGFIAIMVQSQKKDEVESMSIDEVREELLKSKKR